MLNSAPFAQGYRSDSLLFLIFHLTHYRFLFVAASFEANRSRNLRALAQDLSLIIGLCLGGWDAKSTTGPQTGCIADKVRSTRSSVPMMYRNSQSLKFPIHRSLVCFFIVTFDKTFVSYSIFFYKFHKK